MTYFLKYGAYVGEYFVRNTCFIYMLWNCRFYFHSLGKVVAMALTFNIDVDINCTLIATKVPKILHQFHHFWLAFSCALLPPLLGNLRSAVKGQRFVIIWYCLFPWWIWLSGTLIYFMIMITFSCIQVTVNCKISSFSYILLSIMYMPQLLFYEEWGEM